jgi:hypothetical protein
MNDVFIWFWTTMIFASVAWYGLLLFYIGARGGKEIIQITKTLKQKDRPPE